MPGGLPRAGMPPISDVSSNISVATIALAHPGMMHEVHDYVSRLHEGKNEAFNFEYQAEHDRVFLKCPTGQTALKSEAR